MSLANDISTKDAISFMRAAKKLGVIYAKFGTLEFRLQLPGVMPGENLRTRPPLKMSDEEIIAADERNQLQMDFDEVKEDLSVLHVEDPVGFEQAMVENLLEDAAGGNIEEAYSQRTESAL